MARPIRMSLEGGGAMKRRLARVAGDQGLRKIMRTALKEVGGELLEVVLPGVPVKSGDLAKSGKVKVMVSSKKQDIRVGVVFGGGLKYAWKVHETHKTHSKFLERPLLAAVRTIGGDIAERVDLAQAVRS